MSLSLSRQDLAYQRMQIAELTHQLNAARHQIEQRDELLEERGLVLVDAYQMHPAAASSSSTTGATESGSSVDGAYPNGDSDSHRLQNGGGATTPSSSNEDPTATDQRKSTGLTLLSKDNAEHLLKTPGYDIDSKLAFLFAEQAKAQDKISRLQSHLEEERERVELVQKIDARAAYKGSDPDSLRQNMQTAKSQALDYKFRLEQATQKITALEGDIIRLESQVKRFKTNLDDAEKKEEQLKQDRRKLQRDVREANILIDELKSENSTLQRKVDKLTRGSMAGSNLRSGSASRTLRDSSQSR
ncbi:LRR domain binding [Sparganum proliferum]